jgi:glycosyltransferase involved in cell wall biosynthesis
VTNRGLDQQRVNVIPIGAYDYYGAWARSDRAERPNCVLFFGRIWAYKGLEVLIEAEPLISREIPDVCIIIAGYGESIEKYRQAMVNPDRFEVHNYRIPDEKVAELFQSANLVILPYVEASQSGVVSVAYAFGKPVVATRVGGIPDVVDHGQTGYLVPPRDPYSLAEAIITLLKDRNTRHEMGRKALGRSQSDMSWPHVARRTLEVYHKALV